MQVAHPSAHCQMVIDDNMMRSFPIVQVEVKIRVPDQLIGRLIGRNGVCLKKIMDDTATHISIKDTRNQHEVQQYQAPEFIVDRIITIRGNGWNTVMLAEKNVQQKLRQFADQDMSANQQFYNASGVIVNSVENIGAYIAPSSVPAAMLPRENTYPATAYNAMPMGVSPQPFYIPNPAAIPNFTIPTGQYGHNVPSVPNSVHIKSRVYVPNQIVGILIGTKGQTIKSVIAESGAIISIEGDHPNKKVKKEVLGECKDGGISSSSNNNDGQNPAPIQQNVVSKQEVVDSLDMKSVAEVEPIAEGKDADGGPVNKTETDAEQGNVEVVGLKEEEVGKSQQQEEEVNGSQPHHPPQAQQTIQPQEGNQLNGNKKNNNQIGSDQRGVFIQGYDFQVSKALYWVYQKVSESQNMRTDEITLTNEAIVPSKVIGRIIGKQGQNVKLLQQRSGATIKVPDDINQNDKNCLEAAVRVVGTFYAVQMVQQHFGTLIMDAEWRESREYEQQNERRSRFREGSR